MKLSTVRTELATELAAVMGASWRGYPSAQRARQAQHAPMVFLRNIRVQHNWTHGKHLVTCEAVFVASEHDTVDVDEVLDSVLSTDDATGKATALAAVTSDTGQWAGDVAANNCQILDELLLGQNSYRAAVMNLELICPA